MCTIGGGNLQPFRSERFIAPAKGLCDGIGTGDLYFAFRGGTFDGRGAVKMVGGIILFILRGRRTLFIPTASLGIFFTHLPPADNRF